MNLFFTVAQNKEKSVEQLFEDLELAQPGLFSPLEESGIAAGFLKSVLLYIVFAYSKDSPLVVVGENIQSGRRKVAEYVALPDELNGPVVMMHNSTVRDVMLSYLEYQSHRVWRHLQRKYDVYEALYDQQMREMFDADGKVATKALVDSSKLIDTLYADIQELETALRAEYAFVIDNFNKLEEEIPQSTERVKSFKVEGNRYVK